MKRFDPFVKLEDINNPNAVDLDNDPLNRVDPFTEFSEVYKEALDWEKDPMNKPWNQNKYFFSDGKTYYEQICKMMRLMSVFKDAFNQIYDNEDEIHDAWENFVENLSATATYGEQPDVTLTWTDTSVNFAFTIPGGEDGVGIQSITFNADYTLTITLTDGTSYTSQSLRGAQGEQGAQGAQGEKGDPGEGLQILDTYPTLSDLQTAHPTGQPGDAYQVGTQPTFTLYIWSSSRNEWVPAGTLGSVSPSLANPLMDGTASPGSSDLYSRGDHVHPVDTSRASAEDLEDVKDLVFNTESLTNQEFIYRETPAKHKTLAEITEIKGNTIKFNQLIEYGDFSSNAWRYLNCSLSLSNNKAVLVSNANVGNFQIYQSNRRIIEGHFYYIKYDCRMTEEYSDGIYTFASLNVTALNPHYNVTTTKTRISYITQAGAYVNGFFNIVFGFNQLSSVGHTIEVENAQVFDLTEIGIDSFRTSEQVENWLSTHIGKLDYYGFTLGDLISFKGTGLKTVGFNQWDEEVESGYINPQTGLEVVNASQIRMKNYMPVLPNTTYFKKTPTPFWNVYYDANKQYIGYGSSAQGTFTTPSNAHYIRSGFEVAYGTIYKHDICINISDTSRNGQYEPYTESTLSLPILDNFPTGMKSAGTAYDEHRPNKDTQRLEMVDLGTLDWAYGSFSGVNFFTTSTSPTGIKPATNFVKPNILISSKYTLIASTNQGVTEPTFVDGTFFEFTNSMLYFKDSSYTSATAFKTAMNGVYLIYELETPVVTTIDEDLTFRVEAGGTEQLLPINGSTPTTSNIIADIDYMSIEDVMNYILDNLDTLPTILRRLQTVENTTAQMELRLQGVEGDTSDLIDQVDTINDNITSLTTSLASKLSCSIIWQNPKGTDWLDTFAGTTIDVTAQDVSQYTYIEGIFILDGGAPYAVSTGLVPLDFSIANKVGYGCGQYMGQSGTNNEYIMYERDITYYTNNLVISDCTVIRSGTVAYSENSHLIPALILGYK